MQVNEQKIAEAAEAAIQIIGKKLTMNPDAKTEYLGQERASIENKLKLALLNKEESNSQGLESKIAETLSIYTDDVQYFVKAVFEGSLTQLLPSKNLSEDMINSINAILQERSKAAIHNQSHYVNSYEGSVWGARIIEKNPTISSKAFEEKMMQHEYFESIDGWSDGANRMFLLLKRNQEDNL